jgi:glycosyltransferase involved in cell wall biosynthesis
VTGRLPRLIVDARKAFDAGIGTYIRNVVPGVLARLGSQWPVAALVPADHAERFDWLAMPGLRLEPVRAAPMGFAEQLELRRVIGDDTLFWATSLAHPLWGRGGLVTTVHDVAQLALGPGDGVPVRVAWAAKALLTHQCRRASAMMAVSEFTRSEFIRLVGRPGCGRIEVTPLGVDGSWFSGARPAGAQAPGPYFVCVGSVRPHKNLARLLQAFAQVADQVPHGLVVAGLEPQGGEHWRWHQALPAAVRPRVRFAGFAEPDALRALVSGADALVFPSLYEGFGLPALEAMAAGCPVLASEAGSLPEVCAGAASALFDPRSTEQIGLALVRHAALSLVERRVIVERGIAHARAQTWQRTADLTAAAIEGVLHQGIGKNR